MSRPTPAALATLASLGAGVALLAACAAPPRASPRVAAPPSAREDSARAVVERFIAAFNRHDVDGMLALAHPEVTWLSVVGDSVAVETRGAEALRRSMAGYFRSLPSARSTSEGVVALGPYVTVRERASWQSAAGPRSQAALAVYEVTGGRVRRVWYYPMVR